MGQRVNQTVSATVTAYLLDTQPGLAKVIAADNGTTVNRYVHDMTGIHSHKDSAGNWEHVVQDGLGSVRGVYANDLSDLYTAQYSPYGEVWDSTGTGQTDFGYTGEWTDQNDLVHLRARYLDPATGNFISLDPMETANRYGYVGGNPINRVDPSGLLFEIPSDFGGCRDTLFRQSQKSPVDLCIDQCKSRCSGITKAYCKSRCGNNCKYYDCGSNIPGSPEYQLCAELVDARRYEYYEDEGKIKKSPTAHIDNHFSAKDVLNKICGNKANIQAAAMQYGVPPELIAGMLASEMFWDYGQNDNVQDKATKGQCGAGVIIYTRDAVGIANPHEKGYQPAIDYLVEQGFDKSKLEDIYAPCNLINDAGAIEAVAVVTRYLMDDYGHGSDLSALSLEDMAMIYAGYRQERTLITDDTGATWQTWWKQTGDIVGNGHFALPFMKYMKENFSKC